jgi:N-acetylneuraminate synthase/N,N'-diacetyllegionaminate synthase
MSAAPLIIIPARGGSKGVPGKNLRTVGGISLIGRAVRTARAAARAFPGTRVIVDSDDQAILAEGRAWGAETPYVRPAELASDTASSLAVMRHALEVLGVTASDARPIVLMQATSPLTPAAHVVACIRRFHDTQGAPVICVAPSDHPPAWSVGRDADGRLLPLYPGWDAARRQDLPPSWRQTGAVNIASAADLHAGKDFVQPHRTSLVEVDGHAALDIDSPADLAIAEALVAVRPIAPLILGERRIGPGHPCFIIAEAGVNHDGDLLEAHRLVDAAADAGADAVKFQTWQTELLCRPGAPKAEYQKAATGAGSDQFAMLKALELPYAWHAEISDHARRRGIIFLSTPDEIESARFLVEQVKVPLLKVGSGELDNLPYLAQLGAFGLPVLLSTGMGSLPEIASALDALGDVPVALFHAVSAYPAPVKQMNVRAIATLRHAFQVPAGLSDHCPGEEAVLAAVGIGLDIWEKHLTTDSTRTGPDHASSLEPREFRRQVALVRAAESALGDGRKVPAACELPTRSVVRKRLHLTADRPAGHRLGVADLTGLRAERGLAISRFQEVVGRRLRRGLHALEALEDGDLDG